MKIAFIKYGGLAAGGTERLLQEICVEISKLGAEVSYFYCDPKKSPGSPWIHPPNDVNRKEFLEKNGIRLHKFDIGYKDLSKPDHQWVSSNFFDVFRQEEYDLVWTAKAGHREYPFHIITLPFVETVTLDVAFDDSPNRIHSIHISNWQRNRWLDKGGDVFSSSILPIPVHEPLEVGNLRNELKIGQDQLVIGFHQRVDNEIASRVPFEALKLLNRSDVVFVIKGGGPIYRNFAREYGLNCIFLEHESSWSGISKFLRTLDVYTHGRSDGETYGTVLAEAMNYSLPIVTHRSTLGANAHTETIGAGGIFAYDVYEYAAALDSFLKSSELREKIGTRGFQFAREIYSRQAFKVGVEKIYNTILSILKKETKTSSREEPLSGLSVLPGTRIIINNLLDSEDLDLKVTSIVLQRIIRFIKYLDLGKVMSIEASGLVATLISIEIAKGDLNTSIYYLPSLNERSDQWFPKKESELLDLNGFEIHSSPKAGIVSKKTQSAKVNFQDGSSLWIASNYSDISRSQYCGGVMGSRIPVSLSMPKMRGFEGGFKFFMFQDKGIPKISKIFIKAIIFSLSLRKELVCYSLSSWCWNSRSGKRFLHVWFLLKKNLGLVPRK